MRFDCHLHTPFCGHASGMPVDYVELAKRRGYRLLTFTCHIPMTAEGFGGAHVRMRSDQLPAYLEAVAEGREAGRREGIEVLTGIEAEIFPDAEVMAGMDETLARHPWDFVLGSLHHQLDGYRQWLRARGITEDRAIVDTYFGHLAEAVGTGRYDSIAHPDVIRMYRTLAGRFEPARHEESIRGFLRRARETGVCLEVNTSGLIKGDYVVHPDPLILDWGIEEGIELTMGSDSHAPHMLGQYFDEVLPMLEEKGYAHLCYFRQRQKQRVPLKEALAVST